jgi:hypothetical protein
LIRLSEAMKIFISWSGEHSLGIATLLRGWIPLLFPSVEPFVSSDDIRKGKRWPVEVSKELETCNFGIVCLTPDNLVAPWLLFEAGALSKSVKEASVYTLLVGGLRASDIMGPLSHFQHTVFEKEDFFKLIKSINDAQAEGKQEEGRLRKIFDKFWDELAADIAKTIKVNSKPEKKRSAEEMLNELLELTGHIARNMPKPNLPAAPNKPVPPVPSGSLWQRLLASVGKASPFTRTYLLEATDGTFDRSSNTFTIVFDEEYEDHVTLVNNAKNIALLQAKLAELGVPDGCAVKFEVLRGRREAK